MMEVHQPLSCLSPTQRLSSLPSHQPPPSLHSPLSLPVRIPATPSPTSTMIIEASLHSSVSTPPDSPQQGETVPNTDMTQKEFIPEDFQTDGSLLETLPKEPIDSRTSWNGNGPVGGDVRDSFDMFTRHMMNAKGLNGDGSPSPVPPQLSPKERSSVISEGEESQRSINECYTPPSNHASEGTDRRPSRRKQTLEDIVRRMRTVEPPENMYDTDEEMDQEDLIHLDESQLPEDEVDGAPLEVPRYFSPQTCAESVIKRSMQGHYRDCEDMEEEEEIMEDNSSHEPENFLHINKSHDDSRSLSGSPELLHEPKMHQSSLTQEVTSRNPNNQGEDLERKGVLDGLPKPGLPPHLTPSLGGGLHCSLPLSSNISETAYSPHHYSTSKMNGWGFPGGLPHMFPFSPAGMLDHHGLGRKFLPFDSKMMPEVDKDYLKCSYCERTFRRQKNLENHIENTHQGKGSQRPKRENGDMYFKCTHCPYTTKHQSNLYVHLRIHTGERPYICGACGVQYSQSHSLKSHIINKHDGIMSYYIKEKRNRSPRGMGYMTTQVVSSAESNIFKLPPPPGMPSLQQSNMELVAKAIELAKSASSDMPHPPPLLPAHPQHPLPHPGPPPSLASPLMSPNAAIPTGPHGVISKHSPQFPFNGHYFGASMPYGDFPATPTPAMIPLPSPGGHLSNGPSSISPTSSGNSNNNNNNNRGEMGLNLSAGQITPTSVSGFLPMSSMGSSLSPSGSLHSSPNNNNNNNNNNNSNANNNNSKASSTPDCGAIDLSKKAQDMSLQRGSCEDNLEHSTCRNCGHANKLKLLRFNVVRMLSILVPNLNFEEKGISADSDSVDELLQDVIESNTHDDDMLL